MIESSDEEKELKIDSELEILDKLFKEVDEKSEDNEKILNLI